MVETLITNGLLTLGVALCPLVLSILLSWLVKSGVLALKERIVLFWQLQTTPCLHCEYFSSSLVLKCAVHPTTALTQAAITCPDFTPTATPRSRRLKLKK